MPSFNTSSLEEIAWYLNGNLILGELDCNLFLGIKPSGKFKISANCLFQFHQTLFYYSLAVRNQDESTRAAAHEIASEMIPYCEQGSTPSLEEASAWRHSFDKLMATPSGRNAFREFLRSEYSEENMLFWLACEDLKQESNKNVIDEKVRRIYEDYVSILSPREVSLDSRARGIINRNIMEPSIHTFDEAQFQVYMLMLRDSYPRFVNSAIYKELVMSHFQATAES
ncbi:regulator of G-protein signaling 20 isoform X1 [Pantherophis guttatus]|uniref:Regulator of G-protein signaling 20 isoform X1 n=1 Tax=Pantherophis guttatus TaxID=94885 RepID=A0ABM3YPB5_PANGU|nr:regulator of G-protein signaling 20 isoform X1 [Pantherophis guttatus]